MPSNIGLKAMILSIVVFFSVPYGWKKEVHFLVLPLIEGGGIYSATRILQDSRSPGSKASAAVNLSLLGIEAGLGSAAIFGPKPNVPSLLRIHRIAGYALAAAALWMSISAANDATMENRDRNFCHAYALAAAVPILIYSF